METTPLPISPLLVVADRFMQQERWASDSLGMACLNLPTPDNSL
jgi:hypothetical protein